MTARGYELAPDVRWVVGTCGILLVHPERGAYCSLPYPAAGVWDVFTRGYDLPKVAEMIRHIGGFRDAAEAGAYVADCLEAWTVDGLLRPAQEVRRREPPVHILVQIQGR